METSSAPAARPSSCCTRHLKPEEADIRSLAVPIRDASAALHSGKAERQQLLQNVINDLHEAYLEKLGLIPTRNNKEILRKNLKLWECHISVSWSPGGREAVAQEVVVDFPYAKRQEAPEQKDATGTTPEYETIVCRQTHLLSSHTAFSVTIEPSSQLTEPPELKVSLSVDTTLPPLPKRRHSEDYEAKKREREMHASREIEYMRSTNLFRILQRFSSNPTELEELTHPPLPQRASQTQKGCTQWRRPSQHNDVFHGQATAPAYAALSVAGNRLIEAAAGEATRRRPLSSKGRKSMLFALSKHLGSRKFSRSGKP